MSIKGSFYQNRIISVWSILLIFIFLLWGNSSFAKWHIEPYAGLNFTFTSSKNISLNQPSLETAQATIKEGELYGGFIPGIRLGYSSMGLATGADFSIGRWFALGPATHKKTITPGLPGLFVSYKLPAFFRFYLTVIPYTVVHFSDPGGEVESQYCKNSRGAKLGMSYLSLPFLSINLEYLPLYILGTNCKTWSHTGAIYASFIF